MDKPKYIMRQCSDKESFINTHGKTEYIKSFPIILLKYNKNNEKIKQKKFDTNFINNHFN
jgi:hypothetical protein